MNGAIASQNPGFRSIELASRITGPFSPSTPLTQVDALTATRRLARVIAACLKSVSRPARASR